MRILLAAAEVNPLAKTGGLADVAGSLSQAIHTAGHDIRVIMPAYSWIEPLKKGFIKKEGILKVRMGEEEAEGGVWEGSLKGMPVYLIENDFYYNRNGLYGTPDGRDFPDNARRFAFFCHAVLESLKLLSFRPEVIHCNDWHTALIPVLLNTRYSEDPFYHPIHTVFTIHNLGYQGQFAAQEAAALGIDPRMYHPDYLELHGRLNLLKGGIVFADILTTVSPSYAREIQTSEMGFGLEADLSSRADRLYGILNGIDVEEWSPAQDPFISSRYDLTNFREMKLANKQSLQQELGLEEESVPLLAVVSRLAEQKGIDILIEALPRLLAEELQLVILGTGDEYYGQQLTRVAKQHHGRFSLNLTFSNPLAHRIFAGSDLLLVPSRYEPCGLSQMIGLRYGTVPLVRSTGGLKDTVVDINEPGGKGNGFVFFDYSAEALFTAVKRALGLYRHPETWNELIRRGMSADFSWRSSALEYIALYYKVSVE
ncbi:MAG: glycogen synthase GlgA [Syntrophomonadaceae bacterium]|nr:glycogen synthase GlgA [Syntrophomonadaceae bacterium]